MTGYVLICKPDGTQELVERELPEIVPADPEPSAQEDTDAILIDHEFRLTLLELGITEGGEKNALSNT